MSLKGPELKDHAIVLSLAPYQEKHLIVQLYTLKHGKISAIAMNARNSQKRFGGSLQVGHYVMANLHRSNSPEGSRLWRLDSVDLRDSFAHLRASFEAIDAMSFYLSLVRDLSPESHVDEAIFVSLGRVLRDSVNLDFSRHAMWSKMALWSWWSHHHGFGDMTSAFERDLREHDLEGVWHQILAQDQPQWTGLFEVFRVALSEDLKSDVEKRMYVDWINASGLVWSHFEALHEAAQREYR
ncbi:MAG TPA: DNA repair protein RecO [Bdellovibrionota bacterium]|jgi:hypothetical protein|nr:DNA repair protein RecO [Bdellovibrionota bacterium]